MAQIIDDRNGKVVFESEDPVTILEKSNQLADRLKPHDGLPYRVVGFDSRELEAGQPHPARDLDTGELDIDLVAPGDAIDVDGETIAEGDEVANG